MLAGASCIRLDSDSAVLVVRKAAANVEVRAPRGLLDRVFQLCDGTLAIDEVLARVDEGPDRAEMAGFLSFLRQEGALIDAAMACAEALRYGFQASPFGPARPRSTPPLRQPFEAQDSQRTFSGRRVSAKALHSMLWSLAGVVDAPVHAAPRRTVGPPGGLHLLKVFVALRHSVGSHPAGVYEVAYPRARVVRLDLVQEDVSPLPLCIAEPCPLTFATGMVFLAADATAAARHHGNRSVQYLFMEAGAALHNMALTVSTLGLGQSPVRDFCEGPATALCGLDGHHIILGAATFGAPATDAQRALLAHAPEIEFSWIGNPSPHFAASGHQAHVRLAGSSGTSLSAWGCNSDPALAVRKAMAEAIERDGFHSPRGLVRACADELSNPVDPRTCITYSDAQFAAGGFPFARFDASRPCEWAVGKELASGAEMHVLADLVYAQQALRHHGHASSPPFTFATSSGCAAGLTEDDAMERALHELVERDAFMRHWLQQAPGELIPAGLWPRTIKGRVLRLEAAGCKVTLQRLRSPWLPVAFVAVQHAERHFTTVGAAAHPDFTQGIERALDEVESRVQGWMHGHVPSVSTPAQVLHAQHHLDLYGQPDHFERADAVLFPAASAQASRWPRATAATAGLGRLVNRMTRAGLRPLLFDITPERHCIDQGRTALRVVRAVVPGLIPLAFGEGRQPLGMVPSHHPGAEMPHPFP
jgi:ribosomal protein S12 methylthiotransferase accessory factor